MPDKTILIVDDEEELAENLGDLLEFEGYKVILTSTGEEALEKLVEPVPDIVLLDIQLPGISGIDVLREAKSKYPELPVVMVSASSQKGTSEQVEQLGAEAMVLKPYDQDELLELVTKLTRRSER